MLFWGVANFLRFILDYNPLVPIGRRSGNICAKKGQGGHFLECAVLHYFKYAAGCAFLSSPFPTKTCGILHLRSSRENSLEPPLMRAFLMPKYGPRRSLQYAGTFMKRHAHSGTWPFLYAAFWGTGQGAPSVKYAAGGCRANDQRNVVGPPPVPSCRWGSGCL